MHDILTVAKFSIKDMIKRKVFIVSTIIILLIIIIGFNIPNIIKAIGFSDDKEKILISDKDNIFDDYDSLKELGYDVKVTNESLNKIKEKISNDEASSAIIIEVKNNSLNLTHVIKNELFSNDSEIIDNLSAIYKQKKIDELNLTEEQLLQINPTINYNILTAEQYKVNIFIVMILSMILFFAIYLFAYQVSSSITVEKTSKIIETLVTSTSPKNIVVGKIIGIGTVGLSQILLIVITALISAKIFIDPKILSQVLDLSSFSILFIVIAIVYFILGYFIYSCLYSLTGSTVSKPEDVQSSNTPISIIAIIGFYLAYFTMNNPTGNLSYLASFIPISSPFCMPFRYIMGVADIKDVLISLMILIITIVLIAKISIKVYSNAILNYGTKMNVKNIIKMYKQK